MEQEDDGRFKRKDNYNTNRHVTLRSDLQEENNVRKDDLTERTFENH